jgi:hypothetical protein
VPGLEIFYQRHRDAITARLVWLDRFDPKAGAGATPAR